MDVDLAADTVQGILHFLRKLVFQRRIIHGKIDCLGTVIYRISSSSDRLFTV